MDVESFPFDRDIEDDLWTIDPNDSIRLRVVRNGLRKTRPTRPAIIEWLQRNNQVDHTARPDTERDEFVVPNQRP